jgi:hypothetical protein
MAFGGLESFLMWAKININNSILCLGCACEFKHVVDGGES